MEALMIIKLKMNESYMKQKPEYIVEVYKIDKYGYYGYYKLNDKDDWVRHKHNGKYVIGLFRWEHIFSMEKI
jgi:hypothetical protein